MVPGPNTAATERNVLSGFLEKGPRVPDSGHYFPGWSFRRRSDCPRKKEHAEMWWGLALGPEGDQKQAWENSVLVNPFKTKPLFNPKEYAGAPDLVLGAF